MSIPGPRYPRIHARLLTLRAALAVVVVLIFASGCSLFGVATRSDLATVEKTAAEERDQVARRVASLQGRLDDVAVGVSALEERLAPRVTGLEDSLMSLDSDLAEARDQVRRLTSIVELTRGQIVDLDRDLVTAIDTVGGHVQAIGGQVEDVRRYTAQVDQEAQSAVTVAEHAKLRSQETWETYFGSLLEERAGLQQRLDALTAKIERLQARERQRQEELELLSRREEVPSAERGQLADGFEVIQPAIKTEAAADDGR